MKVLVLGAAGPTGRLFVDQARAAGHEITAFVRREPAPGIAAARIVTGDATHAQAIAGALAGQQAVVSTLGVRTYNPHALQARAMGALVPAMERAGVRRLIVMSALGVGDTRRFAPAIARLMYSLFLRRIFPDKAAGEAIVMGSPLDWTIAYPPLLTNGPASGEYAVSEAPRFTRFPKISRADVAHFMVRALASPEWSRKRVVVSASPL